DAGGGGVDHALDDHGHPDPGPVDLVGLPVGGGALVVERGPAAADRVDHRVGALDAEVGVLLPGEAGVGQVLGGGAGAHGDRAAAHPGVGLGDGLGRHFAGGVGGGGDAEAGRHPLAGRGHLPQVGGLAADEAAHVAADLVQIDDRGAADIGTGHSSASCFIRFAAAAS